MYGGVRETSRRSKLGNELINCIIYCLSTLSDLIGKLDNLSIIWGKRERERERERERDQGFRNGQKIGVGVGWG